MKNIDLVRSELVIYGVCSTAEGGKTAENIVSTTVAAGARTVIGFENSVYSIGCNRWCAKFFEYYQRHYNDSTVSIYDVCYYTDLYMQQDEYYEGYKADGTLISLANYVVAGEQDYPNR